MELFFWIVKGKIDLFRLCEIENVGGLLQFEKKINVLSGKDCYELDVYLKINKKEDIIIIGEDFKNIQYLMVCCCNFILGDLVFGFIIILEGIKIYCNNCLNVEYLQLKMVYWCVKVCW